MAAKELSDVVEFARRGVRVVVHRRRRELDTRARQSPAQRRHERRAGIGVERHDRIARVLADIVQQRRVGAVRGRDQRHGDAARGGVGQQKLAVPRREALAGFLVLAADLRAGEQHQVRPGPLAELVEPAFEPDGDVAPDVARVRPERGVEGVELVRARRGERHDVAHDVVEDDEPDLGVGGQGADELGHGGARARALARFERHVDGDDQRRRVRRRRRQAEQARRDEGQRENRVPGSHVGSRPVKSDLECLTQGRAHRSAARSLEEVGIGDARVERSE